MIQASHITTAERKETAPGCVVYEHGNNGIVDGADIFISGPTYPPRHYAVNNESSYTLRVLGGTGILQSADEEIELRSGTVVIVDANEHYRFRRAGEGVLHLFMACSPPWSADQYAEKPLVGEIWS